MPKELKVIIVGDASQLNKTFGSAASASKSFGDRMKDVGKSVSSVGKHMTVVGGIFAGASVVIGKKLVDSALAAEAAQAKLDRAFQNSGLSAQRSSRQVEELEKAGRQLGFTNVETIDSFTKLIQSGESVTQATRDIGLAQDYARATGRDLETATGALVKVHQGLLRPLKELGISLPQNTDHMKALTAAHKESKTAITANEKALAFQQDKLATGAQAIDLMTQKLHGQADAFSQTSAGGMAAFQAKLEGLQESLGKLLLPFLDKAVGYLNRMADAFNNLSPQTKKIIVDVGLAAAAFGTVLLVIGPLLVAIGTLITVVGALASPVGILVIGIAALVAALVAAVLWPDKLQKALERMGLSAKDSKEIVDDLRNAFTAIHAVVAAVMPAIQAIVVPALKVIQGILMIVSGILRGDFSEAWKGIKLVVANELKFVLAILTAFPRIVLGVAKQIGAAVLRGIGDGLQALPGVVKAGLAALPGVLRSVASQAVGWAAEIGAAITRGILSGMSGLFSAVKDKIIGGVKGAIDGAMGIFGHSPQEVIGVALVDGIIRGWNQKQAGIQSALVDGINQAIDAAQAAVQNAQGVFSAAFDTLASTALDAFDKVSEQFQTKTEKKIARQDAARAAAERQRALAEAQTGLATAQAGGDPGEIMRAQQAVNDALFAIQRAADEKRAAQERKAYEDSRALQRRHFDEQLSALEAQMEKGAISAQQFRQRVLNLFEKFDVPFRNAGKVLGSALAEGLHDSFGDAAAQAKDLVEAIARALKKIELVVDVTLRSSGPAQHRAGGGPVQAGSPYIVGEKGPELFVPKLSGTIVPAMAGSGGAMAEIHTNVYLDSTQIAEVIRREYLRFEKRNGRSAI